MAYQLQKDGLNYLLRSSIPTQGLILDTDFLRFETELGYRNGDGIDNNDFNIFNTPFTSSLGIGADDFRMWILNDLSGINSSGPVGEFDLLEITIDDLTDIDADIFILGFSARRTNTTGGRNWIFYYTPAGGTRTLILDQEVNHTALRFYRFDMYELMTNAGLTPELNVGDKLDMTGENSAMFKLVLGTKSTNPEPLHELTKPLPPIDEERLLISKDISTVLSAVDVNSETVIQYNTPAACKDLATWIDGTDKFLAICNNRNWIRKYDWDGNLVATWDTTFSIVGINTWNSTYYGKQVVIGIDNIASHRYIVFDTDGNELREGTLTGGATTFSHQIAIYEHPTHGEVILIVGGTAVDMYNIDTGTYIEELMDTGAAVRNLTVDRVNGIIYTGNLNSNFKSWNLDGTLKEALTWLDPLIAGNRTGMDYTFKIT